MVQVWKVSNGDLKAWSWLKGPDQTHLCNIARRYNDGDLGHPWDIPQSHKTTWNAMISGGLLSIEGIRLT
jgi:hypothetical protein